MHRAFDAHYKKINVIKFSIDDYAFITGSDDSSAHVWLLTSLFDTSKPCTPLFTLSSHTLPVTDISLSPFQIPLTRVYTSSMDRTVKIWEMREGKCLATLVFPNPITAMCIGGGSVFAGSDSGTIYVMDISDGSRGLASTDKCFTSHRYFFLLFIYYSFPFLLFLLILKNMGLIFFSLYTSSQRITSISVSMDTSLLLSSSEDGSCIVWDVAGRQPLRKNMQHKGPVEQAILILKPNNVGSGTPDPLLKFEVFKRYEGVEESDGNIDVILTGIEKVRMKPTKFFFLFLLNFIILSFMLFLNNRTSTFLFLTFYTYYTGNGRIR